MTAERNITVLSPAPDRIKLKPGEAPPGFPGMPNSYKYDPASVNLAKRLDTLENKTIYMVDIGFGGGINFMQEVQRWFAENRPSVKTIVRRKPGQVFLDDSKELWEEIKGKGDAVILGVAG
jgi:hypothetical protein